MNKIKETLFYVFRNPTLLKESIVNEYKHSSSQILNKKFMSFANEKLKLEKHNLEIIDVFLSEKFKFITFKSSENKTTMFKLGNFDFGNFAIYNLLFSYYNNDLYEDFCKRIKEDKIFQFKHSIFSMKYHYMLIGLYGWYFNLFNRKEINYFAKEFNISKTAGSSTVVSDMMGATYQHIKTPQNKNKQIEFKSYNFICSLQVLFFLHQMKFDFSIDNGLKSIDYYLSIIKNNYVKEEELRRLAEVIYHSGSISFDDNLKNSIELNFSY